MGSNDVGKRIAKLRKQNGWSQSELAKKLNVSDKAVSKWENGGMPSVDIFPLLAKLFNVSIDYLMLGDENERIENEGAEIDMSEFAQSIESLSIEDLSIILSDQRDLYTEEELKILQARYNELKGETVIDKKKQKKEAISKLPENLVCPKCDGINPTPKERCVFCGHPFIEEDESNENEGNAGCLGFIIALLFPLFGLLIGIIKNDKGLTYFSIILLIINVLCLAVMLSSFGSILNI